MTRQIGIETKKHVEMAEITTQVRSIVHEANVDEGYCMVFVPHTTCGITLNENADPDVKSDIIKEMNKIVPLDDGYAHLEGNSAAHIKSVMTGFTVMIPIVKGEMAIGQWQGIYLFEFDGPRTRRVIIQVKEQ